MNGNIKVIIIMIVSKMTVYGTVFLTKVLKTHPCQVPKPISKTKFLILIDIFR